MVRMIAVLTRILVGSNSHIGEEGEVGRWIIEETKGVYSRVTRHVRYDAHCQTEPVHELPLLPPHYS
ncbi:hypothetical protein J6590_056634 [Homalodisca vitripennis]|nr:hypothetical protein J6590_056634 [Homalodisca vitripennis]